MDITSMSPHTGRLVMEDGSIWNMADALAELTNADPVSKAKIPITAMSPRTGRMVREDGSIINIADLLKSWIDSGGSGGGGGSYTLPQATESILGGIKAKQRTTETAEAAIDPETGKMYVPEQGQPTQEQVSTAVEKYLKDNPVQAGSLVVKDHIISLMGGTENAET